MTPIHRPINSINQLRYTQEPKKLTTDLIKFPNTTPESTMRELYSWKNKALVNLRSFSPESKEGILAQISFGVLKSIIHELENGVKSHTTFLCKDKTNELQGIALTSKIGNNIFIEQVAINPDSVRSEASRFNPTKECKTELVRSIFSFALKEDADMVELYALPGTESFYKRFFFRQPGPENKKSGYMQAINPDIRLALGVDENPTPISPLKRSVPTTSPLKKRSFQDFEGDKENLRTSNKRVTQPDSPLIKPLRIESL